MTRAILRLLGVVAVLLTVSGVVYFTRQLRQAVLPAATQRASAEQAPVDPHILALEFVDKMHLVHGALWENAGSAHDRFVTTLRRNGITEANATKVVDGYLLPAYRARLPLLHERLAEVCGLNLTVDEMKSVTEDQNSDVRRTVLNKIKSMSKPLMEAEQNWGSSVIEDVLKDNAATFAKMNVSAPAVRR